MDTVILAKEIVVDYALPIGAIAISIIALLKTDKNLNKQIKANKLEEIVEILDFFESYYQQWYIKMEELIHIKKNLGYNEKKVEMEKFVKDIDAFVGLIGETTVFDKVSRVRVLTNAYIHNNHPIKPKIIALTEDIRVLFLTLVSTKTFFVKFEDLPTPNNYQVFSYKLIGDIICEMNLGNKALEKDRFIAYKNRNYRKEMAKK